MTKPYIPSTDEQNLIAALYALGFADNLDSVNRAGVVGKWARALLRSPWLESVRAEARAEADRDYYDETLASAESAIEHLEAERDALAAVIEKVREWVSVNEIAPVPLDWRGLGAILARRSVAAAYVLAERDARIRKQLLAEIDEQLMPTDKDFDGDDVLDRVREWLREQG